MLGLTKELPFPEHGGARGPWFSTFQKLGEAPVHSLPTSRALGTHSMSNRGVGRLKEGC